MRKLVVILALMLLTSCAGDLPSQQENPDGQTEESPDYVINEFLRDSIGSEPTKQILEITEDEILYLQLEDRSDSLAEIQWIYPPTALALMSLDYKTNIATKLKDIDNQVFIRKVSDELTIIFDHNTDKKFLMKDWLKETEEVVLEIKNSDYIFDIIFELNGEFIYQSYNSTKSQFELNNKTGEVVYQSDEIIIQFDENILFDNELDSIVIFKENDIQTVKLEDEPIATLVINETLLLQDHDFQVTALSLNDKQRTYIDNPLKISFGRSVKINENEFIGLNNHNHLFRYTITEDKIESERIHDYDDVRNVQFYNQKFLVLERENEVLLSQIVE